MRTITIDDAVWHVEPAGIGQAVGTGHPSTDIEQARVRFSRRGETRTRIGYVSADVPFEEVPDMALTLAFDEGYWEGEPRSGD